MFKEYTVRWVAKLPEHGDDRNIYDASGDIICKGKLIENVMYVDSIKFSN